MNAIAQTFKDTARRMTRDLRHRSWIQNALGKYYIGRDEKKARFQNWQEARQAAAEIKWEAVNHLDKYLAEFVSKIEARGTKVFWASTGQQACDYIVEVAKKHRVRSIVKSKAMTGEEIHLAQALEKSGVEVVETDLGEYIVQLREEAPYHIVFPAMHLTRHEISDLFNKKLGSAPTDSPEELTMIARRTLRKKYCAADMGISGANFAIAETGMISLTTNEGNGRLSTSLPRIHVALIGIEKVLPTLDDLALFLPMLATAGAAQMVSCYNTFIAGPRQEGEPDGPDEFHVVLLDNGRTRLLANAEQRDTLHCIRCGACLNVCPIYKNVGGHTYGTTYMGPIGSVLTPHLRGLMEWKHLSFASSLCGACSEACPVKIDLHHHLLQNRRNAIRCKSPWWEKLIFKGFVVLMNHPLLYRLGVKFGWLGQKFHWLVKGTKLDPMIAWTQSREAPPLARNTFKDFWRGRKS
jgi:L-lactate dehydrogenase complex protein LldF